MKKGRGSARSEPTGWVWHESLASLRASEKVSRQERALPLLELCASTLLSAGHGGQVHVAGFMGDRHEDQGEQTCAGQVEADCAHTTVGVQPHRCVGGQRCAQDGGDVVADT